MYREKKQKLFDNELLNFFYGGILFMTDEMDGTGRIGIKHIRRMEEFNNSFYRRDT